MTVPAIPADGTYHQVSVLIYDDTNSMVVNRNPWTACHLYLLTPKTADAIDKIGTATFQLVDVGDSSATEKSLMAEGKYVVMVVGKTITFSGKIRRITQNTQNGFTTSTRVKLWDVECDSDLAKLQKTNIDSSVLVTAGAAIYDTPGNIARLILTPTSPARDTRGVINCIDTKISYQLNSATVAEQAGDQYTHLMAVHALTNYDLRSRPDFLLYGYTAFDGSTIITNSGAAWTNDEFIGAYVIFVGRDVPASKAFTTNFAVNNDRLLVTDANLYFAINDRVTLSNTGGALPAGLTATTYYVVAVAATYISISSTRGGAAETFTTNGTGTHAVIMKAETTGVMTYGKVTGNDGTTITCTGMVNAAAAPLSLGYFLIYRGYLIDFAQDLSQPSVIKNFDVNKDVFEYSDNDDKRRLSTKIIATGKDLQGITISIAIAGVHAYDNTTQYFEDSTFITAQSEGYICKNTYASDSADCIISQNTSGIAFTRGATTTELVFGSAKAFPLWSEIRLTTTGTLPAPLATGTTYYVAEQANNNYICISATRGGAKINMTDAGAGTHTVSTYGGDWFGCNSLNFGDNDLVSLGGTVPSGTTAGATYWAYKTYKDSMTGKGCFQLCYTGPGGTLVTLTGTSTTCFVYSMIGVVNNGLTTGALGTYSYIWIYGWDYVIPSGTVMAIISGTSAYAVTTNAVPVEEYDSDGSKVSKIGIANMFRRGYDFSGRGYLLSPRIYVDDYSKVGTNEVLIGEEKITVTATGNDTTYGNYIDVGAATARITSATLKCYPHGVGALVARTNYTEASPQTGSAIDLYGLYIDQRTVDNNITYGTLDTYVTSLLLGLGNFYKKGTTWGPLQLVYVPHVGEVYGGLAQTSLQVPPRTSDRVSFTEYTGATPVEFQIVAVTIDNDRMTVKLDLGDFEKNLFTSLQQSTNAINRTLT